MSESSRHQPASGTELVHDPQTFVGGAPLDTLARLRRSSPVAWVDEPATKELSAGPGYWLILRHHYVQSVLRDPATFSSATGATQVRDPATPADLAYVQRMMLNMDPPEHSRLRRPLQKSFTVRAVTRLEEQIEAHVSGILDRALVGEGRTLDFAKDIAADLPLLTLADVLGVPAEDRRLMFDWSNRVIGFQDPDYAASADFDPACGTEMARAALAARPVAGADGRLPDPRTRQGMADLYSYAHLLGQSKRAEPGTDVMSILMNQPEQSISVEEFENMFWLFAVAGNETLRNGLPGGMFALLAHPEAQRTLRADPTKIDVAVEEMLRWWTPVMVFRRTATVDTSLGGVSISAGEKVVVSFLSANHDESVFDSPDQFKVDRTGNDHLVFGYGPHFCLGSHLARVQMRTMFRQLLDRTAWIESAGEPALLRSSFQRGIKRLPIRWS